MIDEKRLEEIYAILDEIGCLESPEETSELLRLARLGLWAKEYGIPALDLYVPVAAPNEGSGSLYSTAKNALLNLPKE